MRSTTRSLAGVILLVGSAGCLEYETTTRVHPDGSFTRHIVVKGDSAAVRGWRYHIPADTTWTVLRHEQVGKDKWEMEAERTFASTDAWRSWMAGRSRRTLDCRVDIGRSFRFFTTVYRYRETIATYNPFTLVPITDYLSSAELSALLRHEVLKESYPTKGDSLALHDAEDRFKAWEFDARFASAFAAMTRGMDTSSSLLADERRTRAVRETLVARFRSVVSKETGDFTMPEQRVIEQWVAQLREPDLLASVQRNTAALDSVRADLQYAHNVGADTYVSAVTMPGTLISTNGIRTETGAEWKDYIVYAYVSDFVMEAESRVLNVWAVVLSLAVVVGIPVLVWTASLARRRRALAQGPGAA